MKWIKNPAGYCTYYRKAKSVRQIKQKNCQHKSGGRKCRYLRIIWNHEYWGHKVIL